MCLPVYYCLLFAPQKLGVTRSNLTSVCFSTWGLKPSVSGKGFGNVVTTRYHPNGIIIGNESHCRQIANPDFFLDEHLSRS